MYNETYDEYIRSILGYPPTNNIYPDYSKQNNEIMQSNVELERCYPEIYKIIYPMIIKKCTNVAHKVTNEELENMTDEIYYAIETKNDHQLNRSSVNDVKTQSNFSSARIQNKRVDVKEKGKIEENRDARQMNRGLRDLIKILLIRELLNRSGIPQRPRPPINPPIPRPPIIPRPMQTFNPGFGNEDINNDIFEY